ncbi:MAG: hypothetical protein JSR39_10390 [Verrucomicrobia bacterium]|nr:hypothetical protein [Verrucomicrobiota bacterium]
MARGWLPSLEVLALSYACLNGINGNKEEHQIDGDGGKAFERSVKDIKFNGWQRIKDSIPAECMPLMLKAERVCHDKFPNQELSENVDFLFQEFHRRLPCLYVVTEDLKEQMMIRNLNLEPFHIRYLQQQNEALERVWNLRLLNQFRELGAFSVNQEDGEVQGGELPVPVGHREIRSWLNNPANLRFVKQVEDLDLLGMDLKVLPDEIELFTGLTSLRLVGNNLSMISDSIGNLHQLRSLDLGYNRLRELPESVGNLSQLSLLDLSNNQLRELPESIGKLRQLEELSFGNNQLRELPRTIGDLSQLKWVWLDYNPLMPPSFENFKEEYLEYSDQFSSYCPETNLAKLCQLVGCEQSLEEIKAVYQGLDETVRIQIEAAFLSMTDGQKELFSDPGLFARALRNAIFRLYDELGPDQKQQVAYHRWNLAGRPDENPETWSKIHLFDALLPFADALGLAIR